ncbi:MAG: DUF6530 family protein [Tannerellaceae bacterium]|jgi:hypothetical protein|nr:DUF6530 family protein [Tannerellaceae bacterium]
MEAPTHLGHTPIIAVNDYDKIDARYADEGTDVRALSIGLAQYRNKSNEKDKEISLKIWRHPKGRWSPQSEEMPLSRCLDLSILLLGALMTDVPQKYPQTSLRETIVDSEKVKYIMEYYSRYKHYLNPRLIELKNRLDDFIESQK